MHGKGEGCTGSHHLGNLIQFVAGDLDVVDFHHRYEQLRCNGQLG